MQDEFGVVELARSLVSIPSVFGDEGALGRFLADWLTQAGLSVHVTEVAPGRHNVLAIVPSTHSRDHGVAAGDDGQELGLLFHAHLDTTPAHGMKDAFSGRLDNGFLWGRGSVDQKGGLAAAAAALADYRQSGAGPTAPIGLVAVVDEESEHRGSMALARSGLRAKRAIVTEPSALRVVVGCKGTVPLRVRVHGRAAHGCRPWLGINAIEKAMDVARAILDQECTETQLPGLSVVRGSINLGVMQGGVAYNIVPDCCELWFDRRTIPGESQTVVLGQVRSLLEALQAKDPALRAEAEIARPDWHWPPIMQRGLKPTLTPIDSGIIEWVSEHHERIKGSPPERYFTDGYNEMDFLINDMAIPTVQYGPGDPQLCHSDEESLDISQLLCCTRVYRSLIEDVARGADK